jgi:hypothetical protein
MFNKEDNNSDVRMHFEILDGHLITMEELMTHSDFKGVISESHWSTRKKVIRSTFPVLFNNLGADAARLVNEGLFAFNDLELWLKAEEIMANNLVNGHKVAFHFEKALKTLAKEPTKLSPSKLTYDGMDISLFRLYFISSNLVAECHKVLNTIFNEASNSSSVRSRAVSAITAIEQLAASEDVYHCLTNKGLSGLIDYEELKQEIANLKSRHNRTAINWLIREVSNHKSFNPYKPNTYLFSIHQYSEKLALDIGAIQQNVESNNKNWLPNSSCALASKLGPVVKYLPVIFKYLDDYDVNILKKEGLDAFIDKSFWANVEFILINHLSCYITVTLHLSALISYHFLNPKMLSPMILQTGNLSTKLYGLYSISPKFALECHAVLQSIAKKHPSSAASRGIANRVSNYFKKIASSDYHKNLLMNHGIESFVKYPEAFSDEYHVLTNKYEQQSLGVMIREAYPDNFGLSKYSSKSEKTLYINKGGWNIDITGVAELSPKLEGEIRHYLESIHVKDNNPHTPSKIQELRKLSSFLIDLKGQLSHANVDKIKAQGVQALMNDNDLMREVLSFRDQAREQKKQKRTTFQNAGSRDRNLKAVNALIEVLKHVSLHQDIVKAKLPEFLEFDHTGRVNKNTFVSIKNIHFAFPKLADDLRDIHAVSTTNIKSNQVQNISIKAMFRNFLSAFKHFQDELNSRERKLLATLGLAAFNDSQHKLLKKIRKKLRDLAEVNTLQMSSAFLMQSSVNWMLERKALTIIDAYPVSTKRRNKHRKEDNRKKSYSIEQVQELAFYIEECLKINARTLLQKQSLIFARVLLKTGWNVTPVLELETDDLMQMNSPVSGTSTHFIRLFKRRAAYTTQFHKFELDGQEIALNEIVTGKPVANALKDLLYLRDKLTCEVRHKLDIAHPFQKRVALYEVNGEVRCVDNICFNDVLNRMLHNAGCSVRFTPRRIRRGGMNYVYRQVEKDFNKYKVAGNHSFAVFCENYLEVDPAKAEQTLNRALEIMGNYFHGRPITDDITIVTEISDSWQKTPNGECASEGNDDEATAYNKQHYKIHKEQGISNPRCAEFNACLWCSKFRTIADAEHVWKLLSYRDFVIADMEASIVDYERIEMQQEYVRTLSDRVNNVLNALNDINPKSVDQGQELLKTQGIHPFWHFASNSGVNY